VEYPFKAATNAEHRCVTIMYEITKVHSCGYGLIMIHYEVT